MTLMEDKHVTSALARACASRRGAKSQDAAMREANAKIPNTASQGRSNRNDSSRNHFEREPHHTSPRKHRSMKVFGVRRSLQPIRTLNSRPTPVNLIETKKNLCLGYFRTWPERL